MRSRCLGRAIPFSAMVSLCIFDAGCYKKRARVIEVQEAPPREVIIEQDRPREVIIEREHHPREVIIEREHHHPHEVIMEEEKHHKK